MAAATRWLAAYNGTIYTMDGEAPPAAALLARNGEIVAVGSNDDVRRAAAPALARCEALDLRRRCVLPGLTDSHIHFLGYGANLERVGLSGVTSLEIALRRVAGAAAGTKPGEWLQGWGWDHSLWAAARFPDKTLLDPVTGDVPAALRRKDGHMTWLNTAALRAAGITRETPDPPGGRIGRDTDGEPNGLLFETANDLADRAVPPMSEEQVDRALRRAMAEAHRYGLTGVHVPEGEATFAGLQRLDARDELRLRVTMMLTHRGLDAALQTGLRTGFGGDRLRIGPMKIFSDGSLGSETAAMLAPFEGSETNTGIVTIDAGALEQTVRRAAAGGIACAVHAIGDRANCVVLDAYEATGDAWRPASLRQRIEHVQVLHPNDLPRLARLGVIASMQPIHCTQDMDLVDKLWGERGRYAYAFRSLLDSGAVLAFGSDAPVETPDPLAGLYAAVTRQRPDGTPPGGWYPAERLRAAEVVRAYTTGAAYAAGLEHRVGRLAPGMAADFVVLSGDVMQAPAERILHTHVVQTVFDGQVVYQQ